MRDLRKYRPAKKKLIEYVHPLPVLRIGKAGILKGIYKYANA